MPDFSFCPQCKQTNVLYYRDDGNCGNNEVGISLRRCICLPSTR